MKEAILKAARELREEMEAFCFYWSKCHDADICIDRLENGHMSLLGACAIASWVMWRALKRAGFDDAEMVAGWYRVHLDRGYGTKPHFGPHCWVTVEGKLLDLTATQFGVPEPVYVTEPGQDENYAVISPNPQCVDWFRNIYRTVADVGAGAERHLMRWETQSPFRQMYRPDLQVMEDKAVQILQEAA